MRVLVVDDDPQVTEMIQLFLREEGYETRISHDADDGLTQARSWRPDIVLLDLVMPGPMNGMELIRLLRADSDVPVIIMSGHGDDAHKVLGLEYADDYVVKPFSGSEIVARIRAVMRRAGAGRAHGTSTSCVRAGELCIDLATCQTTLGNRTLSLTPIEYRILTILASHPERVFCRDDLVERVWGTDVYVVPHALDTHIRGIRSKLEPDPKNPRHLVSVRGMGFRYVP